MGATRPDLLAVDDELVAVAFRPGGQPGEIAAGAGLGEQLAPDLLAAEQRREVALSLVVGPGVDDRRTGPADTDLVVRTVDPGGSELLVDDQLVTGIGAEAPRRRPVRGDVAGVGELARRWLGMGCDPLPDRSRRASTGSVIRWRR